MLRPLAGLGAAVALGYAATGPLARADDRARALIASRRIDGLDRALPVLTDLGSMYAASGAAAALWAVGRRALARDLLGAAALAWSLAQAAKSMYGRPRPYDAGEVDVLVRRPAGRSYPSGHPAVAAAMHAVLAPRLAAPAAEALARVPKLVGFSRVYVGVHYPADVIGGLMIGRAVGTLWRRFSSGPPRD